MGKAVHSSISHVACTMAAVATITTATTSSDAYLIIPDKIESLIKDFKTHRCALDFDKGFIKASMICSS